MVLSFPELNWNKKIATSQVSNNLKSIPLISVSKHLVEAPAYPIICSLLLLAVYYSIFKLLGVVILMLLITGY